MYTFRYGKTVVVLLATLPLIPSLAEEGEPVIQPLMPAEGTFDFDWLRHQNGEWLKGELLSVRNGVVEFESDEFDTWTLDVEDIAELYTAEEVEVSLVDRSVTKGRLRMTGDGVYLSGREEPIVPERVLSVVPTGKSWWAMWDGEIGLGINIRRGNTEQTDIQLRGDATHRTIWHRLSLAYIGNVSEVDDTEIARNHRADARWDYFIRPDIFLTPLSYEFYSDRFQNIDRRHTATVGGGYEIVDRSEMEWSAYAAVGYQYIAYRSTPAGDDDTDEHGVVVLGTSFEADLTDSTEVYLKYEIQQSTDDGDARDHHLRIGTDVDITGDLELAVDFVWDRIGEPQRRADGTVPEEDDYTLTTGIDYEF